MLATKPEDGPAEEGTRSVTSFAAESWWSYIAAVSSNRARLAETSCGAVVGVWNRLEVGWRDAVDAEIDEERAEAVRNEKGDVDDIQTTESSLRECE
ncbi:hypothetical protein BLNAU_7234 [Blattamonas nauphoetae]|uniref:Uncharacterized protein n=1 Tax=Blattamonas nauphoetae TaxID=2049346 RepID=A0ABQ9Y255_9EUKA|nr:hypothetical protein BLNAU_7234 [Blattamonas nauphoetae]